jgi:glyoxylase-like metal-dependent hydrolase (beta-lactamase superfamily II)
MRDYFTSLERMLSREDALYCPGHGPVLSDPKPFVRDLLLHRQTREAAILAALGHIPQSSHALMERLYSKVDPLLKRAAERNVAAHLQKLAEEGLAQDAGAGWISLRTPSAGG